MKTMKIPTHKIAQATKSQQVSARKHSGSFQEVEKQPRPLQTSHFRQKRQKSKERSLDDLIDESSPAKDDVLLDFKEREELFKKELMKVKGQEIEMD